MISLHLRDKNQIINITIPGKGPLQGRGRSSRFYHTSLDFLCAALGLCSGGTIINYCRFNDLNPQIFESVNIAFSDNKFIIIIKRPQDFTQENMDRLTRELEHCPASTYLVFPVEVKWDLNETPITELIKEPKGCCGQ